MLPPDLPGEKYSLEFPVDLFPFLEAEACISCLGRSAALSFR